MRGIARTVLIGWCLIAIAAAAAASATHPAPPGEVARPADDRPMGTPVTLERDAVTLQELLTALGDQADFKLAAGRDVQWDQVTLHVRDRPIDQVMTDLAELLNYSWERGPREQRILSPDLRARAHEEDLRQRWYGAAVDLLLEYAALARRPPEYYIRLKETLRGKPPPDRRLRPPALDIVTRPGSHASLRLLFTLSREQLLALVSANELGYYLPWREMSPAQREMALQIADEMEAPRPHGTPSLPDARRWVQQMGLRLLVYLGNGTHHPSGYMVFMGKALLEAGFAISTSPAPRPAEARGRPYPARDSRRDRGVRPLAEYQDLEEMPFPARGFRQSFPSTWPEVFAQLAERLPFALYSDSFAAPPVGRDARAFLNSGEESGNPPLLPLEQMSVAAVLDALCVRHGKIWWREGDALFFRGRTWFLERLAQPPPPVVATLRRQLQAHGKLDAHGVTLLARLTYPQFEGLQRLVEEDLKRRVAWPTPTMYRLLQAYETLTEEQQAQVLADGGLPLGQMTPAQQHAYQEALFLASAPTAWLAGPPPFHFEQSVSAGEAGGNPSVGELVFLEPPADEAARRAQPRRSWPRLGRLLITFVAAKPPAENRERRL